MKVKCFLVFAVGVKEAAQDWSDTLAMYRDCGCERLRSLFIGQLSLALWTAGSQLDQAQAALYKHKTGDG